MEYPASYMVVWHLLSITFHELNMKPAWTSMEHMTKTYSIQQAEQGFMCFIHNKQCMSSPHDKMSMSVQRWQIMCSFSLSRGISGLYLLVSCMSLCFMHQQIQGLVSIPMSSMIPLKHWSHPLTTIRQWVLLVKEGMKKKVLIKV